MVKRLAGRRAGALSAIILATSSQWLFITRQAMTDMAFVAPMTIALALAGMGLLLPEEEREKPLPRRSFSIWSFDISYPHAGAFYGFLALFVLTTLPQLIIISIQLHLVFRVGATTVRMSGVVPMLPYIAAFLFALWWCARAENKRQLYLFSGYVLCALASLAKGPAGLALPALVLILYLVVSGRLKEIWTKLEIPRGCVLFIATCFPWYHAMLIRHGMGFWNEFIGDNYVHRAEGRHGDRGQFDYYLTWIGYGMFPWSGLVTLGGLLSFKKLRDGDPKRGLVGFALVWFIVEFAVVSLVNTKFHHYILPALPALAILAGLLIDEILTAPRRVHVIGSLLVAAPVTFLCGRDLAAFPPRLLWMFNYDYVNMPGTGRPWPLPSIYGTRYEYGTQILLFAICATVATAALGVLADRKIRKDAAAPVADAEEPAPTRPSATTLSGGIALFLLALGIGLLLGPKTVNGAAPTIPRLAWLLPTALMVPFWVVFVRSVSRGRSSPVAWAAWTLALVGVVWSGFLADKILVELSPHWSQKHVIASYYSHRKSPDEKLIAWQLYWRGENFYTKNAIYSSVDPNERTVFLGDHNAEKMQKWFAHHTGRRVFFVVERTRFEALRSLLPPQDRASLTIVDESNNKIYLAVAQL